MGSSPKGCGILHYIGAPVVSSKKCKNACRKRNGCVGGIHLSLIYHLI